MKIAVISDIHGNIYALDEVLKDIKKQNVNFTICLGDLVGYGCNPNEVIERIKEEKIPCIKGNYDASVVDKDYTFIRENEINSFSLPWAIKTVTDENINFLKELPKTIVLEFNNKKIQFVHGSPRKINEYLTEDYEKINEIIDNFNYDILVCAHTHIPYVKTIDTKLIINDGSVGKPKNGTPNGTYAILNISPDDFNAEINVVQYNYEKIMSKMRNLDFPEKLIKSYKLGKE
ncbi:MAG: metallophosphoesterase family protein [Clostridium perfringens]|nr:metallophosphoesterase family protein [Clostridium perfringens]